MIDGVCGGVAEFFGLDPTLVRIAWVLLTLLGGSGILLYIIAMIIMPTNPSFSTTENTPSTSNNHRFWGILLVVVGLVWLVANLGFPIWHRWWGFSWDLFLPLVLVLAGVAFLFGGRNYVSSQQPVAPLSGSESPASSEPQGVRAAGPTRLNRSRRERKLFGVCGGLGTYFNVDPTIVRVLFVISAFASFGLTVFVYILMAIVVPNEPLAPVTQ